MQTSVIKKTLLLLATVLVSGSAWAEWVRIAQNSSSYTYIDFDTIRKDGNLVRVWKLSDLKQRDIEDGELSRASRTEYDCKQERYKLLAIIQYSEPMSNGTVLFNKSFLSEQWQEIPPGSTSATVLKIVCAR